MAQLDARPTGDQEGAAPIPTSSRKHAYIMLTPFNPTFI